MMHQKGLTKLVEECSELIKELGDLVQVAAKKMSYHEEGTVHPDGAGDLHERIEDEMGDVLAAILFVSLKLRLDKSRIDQRVAKKLNCYDKWDTEEE